MFTIHILIVWTLEHFSFRVMISRNKNNIIITELLWSAKSQPEMHWYVFHCVKKIFILDHQHSTKFWSVTENRSLLFLAYGSGTGYGNWQRQLIFHIKSPHLTFWIKSGETWIRNRLWYKHPLYVLKKKKKSLLQRGRTTILGKNTC